ncbi:Dabb family protein [Enterobacter ludwigii]
MIRHILFIKFKLEAGIREVEHVRVLFLRIKNKVEGILNVEWGENDSPEMKNSGYTHCVLMTFADESVRQRYLLHPSHIELKDYFKPLRENIIVLDYTVKR